MTLLFDCRSSRPMAMVKASWLGWAAAGGRECPSWSCCGCGDKGSK